MNTTQVIPFHHRLPVTIRTPQLPLDYEEVASLSLLAEPQLCAWCWPRHTLTKAADSATGAPCCAECMADATKGKPNLPRFVWGRG